MTPRTFPILLALSLAVCAPLTSAAERTVEEDIVVLAGESGPEFRDAREAIVVQGEVVLPQLRALTMGHDPRVATAALVCIGWIEDGEIYRAFEDEEPQPTRAGTLRYTSGPVPHDETLTPLLMEMLLWGELDPARRLAVLDLLRRIRDPRAVDALAWTLAYDPAAVVRMTAAEALERSRGGDATTPLIAAAGTESDPETRQAIIRALGGRKDGQAVAILMDVLASDDDPGCRTQAAQSLGWIRDDRAALGLVAALRGDSDAGVRGHAALALGKVGGDGARTALLEARSAEDDPEVVRLAGVALERIE